MEAHLFVFLASRAPRFLPFRLPIRPFSVTFAEIKTGMSEDFDIREETLSNAERDFENALRPLKFSDFNGWLRT